MYHGDIDLDATIDIKFTTRRFTTGAPFTLAGSPVVSAYIDNSTTQLTAGITLSVDFDSVTGLNNVRVAATGANGYAAGSNVALVITTGTVDSVSVVGECIGSFSIAHRSPLRPTVAARTLDVTATGAAGIDWGNVENPSTAVNLSATNIDVDQVVASVSGAVGSVTGAVGSVTGNVGGNVTGSVGSVAAGGITAASIATDAIDADAIAADAVTEIQAGLATSAALATVQADTDNIQTRLPAALVGGRMDSSVGAMATDTLTADALAADAVAEIQAGLATTAQLAPLATTAQLVSEINDVQADIAALNDLSAAQVNAEVLDVLSVDTFAEPTGIPPATDTLEHKIGRLHQALRNQVVVDSNTGKKQFFTDAGAALWEKDLTDAGGVYTETEGNAP